MKQITNKYEFNDCGVCMNPNIIFRTCSKREKTPYNGANFTIKTCQVNGYWYYGCGADSNKGNYFGFGFPCSASKRDRKFTTEEEAIYAAAEEIKKVMNKNHAEVPNDFWKMLDDLTKKHPVQLELFKW